jgi:hypothetical protein
MGTNAAGDAALPNGESGVDVRPGYRGITISNAQISGQAGAGVWLRGDSHGSTLSNNRIGTNASGTAALSNGTGVLVNGYRNTLSGNTISGNGRGVEIRNDPSAAQPNAWANALHANFIGTNHDGSAPVPNETEGVYIAAPSTVIGQLGANVIAYNGGAGIAIEFGWDNRLTRAFIHDNGGLALDLLPAGPTPNDPRDADGGPNRRQNYPVVTKFEVGDTGTTVEGTLDSAPETTYVLRFYRNFECDSSGFGEANGLLMSMSVTTDASGHVSFSRTTKTRFPVGVEIAATAMDPQGSTSELSACTDSTAAPPAGGDV